MKLNKQTNKKKMREKRRKKKYCEKKGRMERKGEKVVVKTVIAQYMAIHAFVTSLKINISRTNEPHF